MRIDFNEVKVTKNLTEGTHDVEIVGAKEKTSANGTPMLNVVLKGEEDAIVSDNICMTGPGAFRMQQFLKAVSVSEDDAVGMEAADFIGMSCTIEVVEEEYNNVLRAKVKKYIA